MLTSQYITDNIKPEEFLLHLKSNLMTVVLQLLISVHTTQTLLRFANVTTDVSFFHPVSKGVSLLLLIVRANTIFFWTTAWISTCSYTTVSFTVVFQILKSSLLFQALSTFRNGPSPLPATKFCVLAVLWSIHGFSEFSFNIFYFIEYILQMKSAPLVLLQLPLISKIISSKFNFCKENQILQVSMFMYRVDSTEQVLSCNWKLLQGRKSLRYTMSLQHVVQ